MKTRTQEMIYEHPKGAKLKMEYVHYPKKSGYGMTHKKVLSWQAPKGITWNEIGEWNAQTKAAHMKAFDNAREALDHVTFDSLIEYKGFFGKIKSLIHKMFSTDD